MWFQYEHPREWVLTPPRQVERTYHKDRSRKLVSWRFSTHSHPVFPSYHPLVSPNGIKTIPEKIGDLVTHLLSLAVWLMDDGNRNKDVLFLSNPFLSLEEQERLKRCLWE